MVFALQSYSAALCMLAVGAEAVVPRSVVLGGAKSAAVLIQGVWLIMIANIMWTGQHPERVPGLSVQPCLYWIHSCRM